MSTSDELEMSVIGGLLLEEGEPRERAFARLRPKCFQNPLLRRVYQNLLSQYRDTGECDCPGACAGIGNPEVIRRCMDTTAIRGVLLYHTAALFDNYRRRVLLGGLEEVRSEIAFDVPTGEIMGKLRRALEIQEKLEELEDGDTCLEFADSIIEYLSSLYAEDSKPVKTGISSFDFLTGGFQRKSVNVLSGRSGMGKTDFAVYLATRLAAQGNRVLYLTMEMPRTQLMERIASNLTGIDSAELSGREDDGGEKAARVSAALDAISHIPLAFDEQQDLTPGDISAKIRRHRPDVVFIDHLGLMRQDPKKQPWQNAFDNSQELKKLAMRENVILVELVQQNREVEARSNKRGKISDLKGSDGISNDADTVMFITAEMPDEVLDGDRVLGGNDAVDVRVNLPKCRQGKMSTALFRWQPQYHRYIPVDRRHTCERRGSHVSWKDRPDQPDDDSE